MRNFLRQLFLLMVIMNGAVVVAADLVSEYESEEEDCSSCNSNQASLATIPDMQTVRAFIEEQARLSNVVPYSDSDSAAHNEFLQAEIQKLAAAQRVLKSKKAKKNWFGCWPKFWRKASFHGDGVISNQVIHGNYSGVDSGASKRSGREGISKEDIPYEFTHSQGIKVAPAFSSSDGSFRRGWQYDEKARLLESQAKQEKKRQCLRRLFCCCS